MNDFEAISQLVLKERMYRGRHVKEAADCYFPDATVTTSWQSGPVSTFLGKHPVDFDNPLPMTGRFGTPIVHQNGDRAYVELSSTTNHWQMVNDVEAVIESYMRLIYRVEKRNGDWKIVNLTSIDEADKMQPAIPGQELKVNPDDVANLRKSYRWLAYGRLNAGGKISQDLLGTDRKADEDGLYQKAEDWIHEKD
ncbi:hypothetical protein ACFP1H_09770 [Secundilactobacillus hailunensis]|uniref:SnoaL-like domain-containing protein n=1 Tax=Secundilactobacillus hailunensis TaxID=2559923 RepID=A0ABW1T9V5_9LACO|nr:hypothetical protein [Secundilactobacillus hailunensis]